MIATVGGAGYLPSAPGTWGSLAALVPGYLLLDLGGAAMLAAATLVVLPPAWWATARYLDETGEPDPSPVVVDELIGQWLTLLAAMPGNLWHAALAFGLFRLFDILKPWPIRVLERQLPGAAGVILDDALAAIYAGACLLVFIGITVT